MTTPSDKLLDEAIVRLRLAAESGDASTSFEESEKIDLKHFTREQLNRLVREGFGEKAYRAEQLWGWMYLRLARSFEEMTNLSKGFRSQLQRFTRLAALRPHGQLPSGDGTSKLTYVCEDNAVIESVWLPFESHNALCISSQVGCAMGCTFCYTAKMGLSRHLSAAEIVEQVVEARRMSEARGESLLNIVFMGMGEPLHNLENVLQACRIVTDQDGLDFSRRKVTVSTSGLVPAIKRFVAESDCQLAVSLNATTDVVRSQIMPVNDRWNLDELMTCLRELPLERRQRVTLEYVLLKGVNDSLEDAQRIVELIRGVPAKINIIPFNPHPESPFDTPSEERIDAFQRYLIDRNVTCLRRKTRGRDEMAACGQLGKPGERVPKHLSRRLEQLREQLG